MIGAIVGQRDGIGIDDGLADKGFVHDASCRRCASFSGLPYRPTSGGPAAGAVRNVAGDAAELV